MGTIGGRNGDQMATKWGTEKRTFEKLTETSQFIDKTDEDEDI